MNRPTPAMPDAQEVLDTLPVFAMVLDEKHRIVMSNSWFAENTGDSRDFEECPIACYERVHGIDGPHPDCPLAEAARTGKRVTRPVTDSTHGQLTVTVIPFAARFGNQRLFLHLTEMK